MLQIDLSNNNIKPGDIIKFCGADCYGSSLPSIDSTAVYTCTVLSIRSSNIRLGVDNEKNEVEEWLVFDVNGIEGHFRLFHCVVQILNKDKYT